MACAPDRRRGPDGRRAAAGGTGIAGEILHLGGPSPQRACRRRRGRPATGCCATPAAATASCTCWWRIMPATRPRRSPCALARQSGPTVWPAWRPPSSIAMPGCCGRCSGDAGPAHRDAPRRALSWIDDPSNVDRRFERGRVRAGRQRSSGRQSRNRRSGRRATALWPQPAWMPLEVGPDGEVAPRSRPPSYRDWTRTLPSACWPASSSPSAGGAYPPRRDRLERAAWHGFSQGAIRGKSGKSQDFTLSGCRLMLRQVPGQPTAALDCPARKVAGGVRGNGASPSFRLHFSLAALPGAPHLG